MTKTGPKRPISKDDRRDRVLELFGKSDRRIAERLIDEGYFGPLPKLRDQQMAFILAAKQTVCRDRHFLEAEYKESRKLGKVDSAEASFRYIARLRSRIEDLETVLESPSTRSTAAVMCISEIRQVEHLIAKAQGVADAVVEVEEVESKQIAVGLVIGTSNVSQEMKERLRKQGVEIGDD